MAEINRMIVSNDSHAINDQHADYRGDENPRLEEAGFNLYDHMTVIHGKETFDRTVTQEIEKRGIIVTDNGNVIYMSTETERCAV